jgi:hypothetical protein
VICGQRASLAALVLLLPSVLLLHPSWAAADDHLAGTERAPETSHWVEA